MMDLLGAARAMAGRLAGDNLGFCGVSTDSRTIAAGELFLALRGENFDGHHYVAAARRVARPLRWWRQTPRMDCPRLACP